MKFIVSVLLLLTLFAGSRPSYAADKESTYDRVMRTGTIRCGYGVWPPGLSKDPNTGKISGLFPDIMTEVGKRLSLKIVWAEDAGWGNIVQSLVDNRYDLTCAGLYASAARARVVDFSVPLFYSPLYVIARQNDARFDGNVDVLNNPHYKIAELEGEISSITQRQIFPNAAADSVPPLSDLAVLLKDVETGKADVTMTEPGTFGDYNLHNPGKLKIVDRAHPLTVFPVGMGLPRNDLAFSRMIDVTLEEMINDGTIARLMNKYEQNQYKDIYLPVKQPYELSK